MASPGKVLTQFNIAHVENTFGAVAQSNFNLTLQSDDVLTAGRSMKIHQLGGLQTAELDADGILQLRAQGVAHLLEGQLHVLNVGLAVSTRVNSDYLHLSIPPGRRLRRAYDSTNAAGSRRRLPNRLVKWLSYSRFPR